jgi:pilus assembly protein FimV
LIPRWLLWNCAKEDATGELIIIQHHVRMPALRLIAFAVLAVCGTLSHAVGLGSVRVQSGLGQPLRATIPLFGSENSDIGDTCIKARLESVDGAFIVTPKAGLSRGPSITSIVLSSSQDINEPAVMLAVEIGCSTPIQRSYQLLLDPPLLQPLSGNGPQSAQADRATNHSRSEVGLPLTTSDASATASLAPWNEKYLLRKKVRSNPEKLRETAPKSVLANKSSGSLTSRDVLKISDDDSISAGARLRLSDSLSESLISTDPVRAEENRAAQLRFAALLRGEDPVAIAEDKARTAESRVQGLQAEAAKYRLQTRSDKVSLDTMRERSFTSTFVFTLSGLLLLSLGAIGWLGWRLRSNKASSKNGWWEDNAPNASDDKSDPKLVPSLPEQKPSVVTHTPAAAPGAAVFEVADKDWGVDETIPSLPPAMPQPPVAAVQPKENSSIGATNPFIAKAAELKVEEISDVTQEAEFWMSLNDPQRALEILETQNDVERPVSPVPWLYLLDLYRETANRAKYDALRARFKRLFNALIPEFDEPREANPRTLEDFPHLMKRITDAWGGPESLSFLESLLVDDRDGARVGFDLPVYRDILLLIGIASEYAHASFAEPLLSVEEQQDYLVPETPEEIALIEIDTDIPEVVVPKIVPPLGGESHQESGLLLEDINFEPMDFNAGIAPKSK